MITHYFKIAFRNILKYKVQHTICVVGIAVGMLCFSLCAYFVRQDDTRYTYFPNYDRMGSFVLAYDNAWETSYISHQTAEQIKNSHIQGIEALALDAGWNGCNITFEINEQQSLPYICSMRLVNPDFLPTYSCEMTDGSPAVLPPNGAFLSESFARRIYGTTNPIGKSIYFSKPDSTKEKVSYGIIAGVMKELPSEELVADVIFPTSGHETHSFSNVALLAKSVSLETINRQLSKLNLTNEQGENLTVKLDLFKDKKTNSQTILLQSLVFIIAGLALFSALINFFTFTIGSFLNRNRELALRRSLGATKKHLFNLLFIELLLTITAALLLSFCLTELATPQLFKHYIPDDSKSKFAINSFILFVHETEYAIFTVCICLLICIFTVARLYKKRKATAMGVSVNKHKIRNFMLGIQFFICFFFVGATTVMYLEIEKLLSFTQQLITPELTARTFTVPLTEIQLQGHEQEIAARIKAYVSVEEILLLGKNDFRSFSNLTLLKCTNKQGMEKWIATRKAGSNYFSFFNIPVTQGAFLEKENTLVASPNFIKWVEEDGTSPSVTLNQKQYQITGTMPKHMDIGNFLKGEEVILVLPPAESGSLCVKSKPGYEKEVKQLIYKIIRTYLPETIPYKLQTIEEECKEATMVGVSLMRDGFILLSVIALLITILGIYSAITIDTKRREKEVAIRKINGAGIKEIMFLFGSLYINLVLLSALFSFPILIYTTDLLLQKLPEKINHTNPLLWLSIFLFVASITGVTIIFKIIKVARINPAEIIKNE